MTTQTLEGGPARTAFARAIPVRIGGLIAVCLILSACRSLVPPDPEVTGERLQAALATIESTRASRRRIEEARSDYRREISRILPSVMAGEAGPTFALDPGNPPVRPMPETFKHVTPIARPRETTPELHRSGLGAPAVGHLFPGGPNAPPRGFHTPLTLLALPESDASGKRFRVSFVDPLQLDAVEVGDRVVPVAMDLDAPLDATRAMGPGFLDGFRFLVRADRFDGESRITFLQPFDPEKQPLVLVHGLMTTPRMWDTLVRELLADPVLRTRYQIWFFFYPTAQPVPLSALELRNALDEAVARHDVRKPMVLVGYSMGGVLARAQVSALSLEDAERIAPNVRMLPPDNPVRRALVFEPRRDVGRVVFMFTPHRGSRLATLNVSAWGTRLIRLPEWVRNELADAVDLAMGRSEGGFPTSIQGLSPHSGFLRELDRVVPGVPTHSIIGNRGRRGDLLSSSDGVVPFASAHLPSADSEVIVPTGHGGFDHPLSILELRRILRQEMVISPTLPQLLPASTIPEPDFLRQRGILPVGL